MGSAPELVVAVSDLHCGSTVGLCPPTSELLEAWEYKASPIQRFLWDCWTHFWDEWVPQVTGGEPFVLILNGDLVEGHHHKTVEVVSAEPSDQVHIAIECLKGPVSKAYKTYIVRGTEVHTRNSEHAIGVALNTAKNESKRTRVWDHLRLRVNDSPCSFAHHMRTTSREWLKGFQLSLEAINEISAWALAQQEPPVCMVRAHRHVFGHYDEGRFAFVALPSWQQGTRFVQKLIPGAMSLFGGVMLDFRGKEPGETPTVHKRLYGPLVHAQEEVA